jgi:PilZ domain-containing protein
MVAPAAFTSVPPFFLLVMAGGAGLLAAAVIYLLLRLLHGKPASAADDAFLREHSVLPENVPEDPEGSDPFSSGSSYDRRTAPRRKGNPVDVLLSDAKVEVRPVRGVVLDRSVSGLALELEEEGEVDTGTIISVRPKSALDSTAWVRVIVRRREKTKLGWILGCEFVKPPDGSALIQFG